MIKKLLFTTTLLFTNYFINAQETKISFEASEGFTLGQMNGQKGWTNWGFVDDSHSNIVNTIAKDGVNSVEVTANDDEQENWGGIFYDAPKYTRLSISADIYLDSKNASDYDMLTLYSMDVDDYERLGGFYYNFNAGVEVGDDTNFVNKSWDAGKWYNLKAEINFTTKKIDYYIDNVKITTTTFNSAITSIKEFDFEFDNYESGFKVDNVKIIDMNNMSVSDLNKSQISIYPNPAKDILNIRGVKELDTFTISDVTGRILIEGRNQNINVDNLKSGLYFINIKTKTEEFTHKFIKQ